MPWYGFMNDILFYKVSSGLFALRMKMAKLRDKKAKQSCYKKAYTYRNISNHNTTYSLRYYFMGSFLC